MKKAVKLRLLTVVGGSPLTEAHVPTFDKDPAALAAAAARRPPPDEELAELVDDLLVAGSALVLSPLIFLVHMSFCFLLRTNSMCRMVLVRK